MFSCRCLQKTYPSQLPSLGVILIFMNEALSIIQRAITSVINRTPSQLLKEIILVDDFSSNGEQLDQRIIVCWLCWLGKCFLLEFRTLWAPSIVKRKGSFTEALCAGHINLHKVEAEDHRLDDADGETKTQRVRAHNVTKLHSKLMVELSEVQDWVAPKPFYAPWWRPEGVKWGPKLDIRYQEGSQNCSLWGKAIFLGN